MGDLVADFLTLVEGFQSGALNGADVNEDILAAFVRLDEPETLGGIEPFDGTTCHLGLLRSPLGTRHETEPRSRQCTRILSLIGSRQQSESRKKSGQLLLGIIS